MIVWGIISAATAACKNAAGLYAVRFFLGFVEAAYFVSFFFYQDPNNKLAHRPPGPG